MSVPIIAFGMPSGAEWIIILVIALLLFGKRLPEVGRSLGQTLVEFKKGLKGVTDEVDAVKRDVQEAVTSPPPAGPAQAAAPRPAAPQGSVPQPSAPAPQDPAPHA